MLRWNLKGLTTLTKTEAHSVIGGLLGKPSKMPCLAWGISAAKCNTGSKLAQVAGATCSKCYAMRGYYRMDVVKRCHEKRLGALEHPLWVTAMSFLLNPHPTRALTARGRNGDRRHFRWFDSGDLQSMAHLEKIVQVCRGTPKVSHWLPTQEHRLIRERLKIGPLPENLVVRLSGRLVDGRCPKAPPGVCVASTRNNGLVPEGAHVCVADAQKHRCLECRACWDKGVYHVSHEFRDGGRKG